MSVRVVIAEDQGLLREGLARLLREQGLDVVATAATLEETLRKARAHRPGVVLCDLRMPPDHSEEGLEVAERLAGEDPPIAVLLLSQHAESHIAMRLLERRSRGVGYLLKDRLVDHVVLTEAIERVVAGGTVIDPVLVEPLVEDPVGDLTPREREILGLMAEGRSNAAICKTLWLSPKTVEGHVRSVFQKLDLRQAEDDSRRVLAVLAWLRASRQAR